MRRAPEPRSAAEGVLHLETAYGDAIVLGRYRSALRIALLALRRGGAGEGQKWRRRAGWCWARRNGDGRETR